MENQSETVPAKAAWEIEAEERAHRIKSFIGTLGLAAKFTFVPYSQSRHYDGTKKLPSSGAINWKVTLSIKGREFLTTDYSQGLAYSPWHKRAEKNWNGSIRFQDDVEAIFIEIETGKRAKALGGGGPYKTSKPIPDPKITDVLHCLVLDSDIINYDGFEDWAQNLGYDPDSRAAEKIYNACMSIALKMRNHLGDEALAKLQELFQDY